MAKKSAAKRKPFGGMTIKPDVTLGKIIGKGKQIPSKMTKNLWSYFKRKKLLVKTSSGPFGGLKVRPDAALKSVIGSGTIPPTKVFKNVWSYIKRKKLTFKAS